MQSQNQMLLIYRDGEIDRGYYIREKSKRTLASVGRLLATVAVGTVEALDTLAVEYEKQFNH